MMCSIVDYLLMLVRSDELKQVTGLEQPGSCQTVVLGVC